MNRYRRRVALAVASLFVLFLACDARAQNSTPSVADSPALHSSAAAPQWLRAELYFAIGAAHAASAHSAEKRWQAFLDREVTPRFPDGFTVLDGYGQWRAPNAALPTREHSKVLVIALEDSPEHRALLEQIREAWKQISGDQSVLQVITPAAVSF